MQILSALALNANIAGYAAGGVSDNAGKYVCVPVLNCHSCPGAVGACPIGAMQAVAGSRPHSVSFYALGFVVLCGLLLGRWLCAFICPFGLIQELLHRLPAPRLVVKPAIDKRLRYLKYAVLLILALGLPALLVDAYGNGAPFFCKYLCPAGTLEGGLLLLLQAPLRELAGGLWWWKLGLLLALLLVSAALYRPFCKYLCPLGAIYGLCNRYSLYQMRVDRDKCVDCGKCERLCPMQAALLSNANSAECIRCGGCRAVCPAQAISAGFTPPARP
ncbi:MAG: 4Fe-4S binding protein [Bacillota bacterium]|nr:4Fe-4S binding protein [Bacillota bacterium]